MSDRPLELLDGEEELEEARAKNEVEKLVSPEKLERMRAKGWDV